MSLIRPLRIVPVVAATVLAALPAGAQSSQLSTFFGGNDYDRVQGVGVAPDGRVFVTGNTSSTNFSGVFGLASGGHSKQFQGGADAFVAALSADLSKVEAWTYLGGTESDRGYGVRFDGAGNVYVSGFTRSHDFPTTDGSSFHGGVYDAFLVKYTPDLKQLSFSTLLGGSEDENPRGSFHVDASGRVWIAGRTASHDFPTTAGVVQPVHAGQPGDGNWDGFLTHLDAQGVIVWSTFLGGSGWDATYAGVALHGDGTIYVAGMTSSDDFPTTPGAYQPAYAGNAGVPTFGDGFVARLSADGSQLLWATYLGGSDDDTVSPNGGLVLDASGRVYVSGQTWSHDFPVHAAAYQEQHSPGHNADGFVALLSADGTTLLGGTLLGGDQEEELSGLALDAGGHVVVGGQTSSPAIQTTPDAWQRQYAGGSSDVLLVKLDVELRTLLYGTFDGGAGVGAYGERGRSLTIAADGNVFVTGDTSSTDFPVTPGTAAPSYHGGTSDGFVARFDLGSTYAYGQGKTTSAGKEPRLLLQGTPSRQAGSFDVRLVDALPGRPAVLLASLAPRGRPFRGGKLYLADPIDRAGRRTTGPTGGATFQVPTTHWRAGTDLYLQVWFRDPAQPDGTGSGLSEALKVTITP